ncbi:MAG: hypothetical protein ACT4QE_22985 [Anaerolineales bacterium]
MTELSLLFFLGWALLASVLCWRSFQSVAPSSWSPLKMGLVLLGVALLVRLVPTLFVPFGNFDIDSYSLVARALNEGRDVYTAAETARRHPYLPLQLYWLFAAGRFANLFAVPYASVVRVLPALADAAMAGVLFAAVWQQTADRMLAWRSGLVYALNPITVLVAAYHGQFDSIPMLLIFVAWWVYTRPLTRRRWLNVSTSALLLGLAILNKSWPVVFLPLMLAHLPRWAERVVYLTLVGAVPVLGVGLYGLWINTDPAQVIAAAMSYNHGIGAGGYVFIVRLGYELGLWPVAAFAWFFEYGRWLTLGALAIVFWGWARREAPLTGLLLLLLTFFALGHAFATQYLAWLIPFAIWSRHWQWLRRYLLAALAYSVAIYFLVILTNRVEYWLPTSTGMLYFVLPLTAPIWLICLGWLANLMQAPRLTKRL